MIITKQNAKPALAKLKETSFVSQMSLWSGITHAGSYVLNQVKKGATIYNTTFHSVADAFPEANLSSSGLEDDLDQVTGFIKSKINKAGKAVISHYIDSDGDGLLTKADEIMAKTAFPVPSLSILQDIISELPDHSLLGSYGSVYLSGMEGAPGLVQDHFGFGPAEPVEDIGSESQISMGLSSAVSSGCTTVAGVLRDVAGGINSTADWFAS